MHVKLFSVSILLLIMMIVGCGQPKFKGKIVFSDDQSPLTQGIVNMVSDKARVRGDIDQNGYFIIGSTKKNDGLAPGTYRIYLTDTEFVETVPGGGLPKITKRIDTKYEKAETSGLEVEVKKSMTYDIEVDRFKK